jgi:uncharacterized membrane protein
MTDVPSLPYQPTPVDQKVRKVELLISHLLRTGVITSLSVIICGTVLTFLHHPSFTNSPKDLARLTKPGAAFPRSLTQVVHGVRSFEGRAVVVTGLLLLILTPVLRVAVSIGAFVYERDPVFVAITATVLALLVASFFLGKIE